MSIIQNKDIYDPSQGNPLKPVLDILDMMDAKIKESANVMKQLEIALKAVSNTGSGAEAKQIIINTEKLTKETEKLTALQKASLSVFLSWLL